MRLQDHGVDDKYARWLSQFSYNPALNGFILLPNYIPKVSEIDGLYDQVFSQDNMSIAHQNSEFF